MNLEERIEALGKLSQQLVQLIHCEESKAKIPANLESLQNAIDVSRHQNGWFTKSEVIRALKGIVRLTDKIELESWLSPYSNQFTDSSNINVAIIAAGNIPLVVFHDFLSVLAAGFNVQVKLSSDDKLLLPALVEVLIGIEPRFSEKIKLVSKVEQFNAVIATGSNNSARYFETYFAKYPNIIRKNRTSVAVLNGNETLDDIRKLGNDIFNFYGLGCRNISKVFLPNNFEINRLFEGFIDFSSVMENNKYMNNYQYNKTLYLMNSEEILDNEFLVLKEDEGIHSPLGVLFYERYSSIDKLRLKLSKLKGEIQCTVGEGDVTFGTAQMPELWDYADGINTLNFLASLKE